MASNDAVCHNDPKAAAPPILEQFTLEDKELNNDPIAELGQLDETYRTTKWEIWAYYAFVITNSTMQLAVTNHCNSYYIGNNGLSLFSKF
jgi:hypothetical protein